MFSSGYFIIVEADISNIGKKTGKKEIIFLLETTSLELICLRLSLNSFLNKNLSQKYPDNETINHLKLFENLRMLINDPNNPNNYL